MKKYSNTEAWEIVLYPHLYTKKELEAARKSLIKRTSSGAKTEDQLGNIKVLIMDLVELYPYNQEQVSKMAYEILRNDLPAALDLCRRAGITPDAAMDGMNKKSFEPNPEIKIEPTPDPTPGKPIRDDSVKVIRDGGVML